MKVQWGMGKKRKKMGRPPKPAAEKWARRVTINLTPAEYEAVASEARRRGLSLSEYVKSCLPVGKGG